MAPTARRSAPNVLVCGTPGTGKSTLCEAVAKATGLAYVDVGKVVRAAPRRAAPRRALPRAVAAEEAACRAPTAAGARPPHADAGLHGRP